MALSTKQYGNIGIAQCIAYFVSKGYTVSIPLSDAQKYDLVVDIDGILSKIQVKTTMQVSRHNVPSVSVKSSGGTSGSIYDTVAESGCDYLYIYHTDLKQSWLIPVTTDMPKSSMNLGEKYKEYMLS